jgi:hypothetical protein
MDKQIIGYLKVFHGLFNVTVMLLFLYHGRLGFTIRRARLGGGPFPLYAVKRHRKAGPVLTALGILGFIAGMSVAYFDEGKVLEHPLHFGAGAAIVMLLLTTYGISRSIKGPDSLLRRPHAVAGTAVLCLYVVQTFFGLSILL